MTAIDSSSIPVFLLQGASKKPLWEIGEEIYRTVSGSEAER